MSLCSVAVAQDRGPASQPATVPTTGRAEVREFRGPPLTSLNDVRLDRRMTLLNAGETLEPTAKVPDDAASYVVELPAHKALILDLAQRAGRPAPTVRVLPEESRTGDRYGIVAVDHAILRKSPKDVPGDRENLSDVTLGEPVWILDADEAKMSLLVHAGDGYLGWVEASAIWPVDAKLFQRWKFRWSRQAMRKPDTGIEAIIKARQAASLLEQWDFAVAGDWPDQNGVRDRPADRVRGEAWRFLGTQYVWGGKTEQGIDCSGLAQAAMASVGIPLPRDADQQSLVGRLVATRWDQSALRPGDLLFYVSPRRGNVNHVAIYLGNGEYIEAAGPDVHVSSMTPGAANFDEKRAATFGWARRVIE